MTPAKLAIVLFAAAGCHGFKAPSYATLSAMAGGVGVAAEKLPAICEAQENAAVDAAASRTEATTKAGEIHARCKATLTILKGTGDGIVSARDAVHDAPAGAELSAVMPWLRLAVKQYCDAAPLLAIFGYILPTFPGVC